MNIESKMAFNSSACVEYVEYCCRRCEAFLFNVGDIIGHTRSFGRRYLFVQDINIRNRLYVVGTNAIRCRRCHQSLGGLIYQFPAEPKIRFVYHLLKRKRKELWRRKRKYEYDGDLIQVFTIE